MSIEETEIDDEKLDLTEIHTPFDKEKSLLTSAEDNTIGEPLDPSEGDLILDANVGSIRDVVFETRKKWDITSNQTEEFKRRCLDGLTPQQAMKEMNLPQAPEVFRLLLASLLADQVERYGITAAAKKALVEAGETKLLVEALTSGDNKSLAKAIEVASKNPDLGRNKTQITVIGEYKDVEAFLKTPDKIEFFEDEK